MSPRSPRTRSGVAIAAIGMLLVTACGHRMSEDELLNANAKVLNNLPGVAQRPSGAGAGPSAVGTPGADSAVGATGGSAGGPAGTATGPSDGVGSGPAGGGGTGNTAGAVACTTTETGPIVIASVGNYSGLAAGSTGPAPQSIGAWATHLNDTGGLCGRQIQLITVDDAGDPARHVAALHDLVENRHVVAFVFNAAPLTASSGREYLESVKVPVIGTDCTLNIEYESPIFFSPCGSRDTLLLGPVTNAVRFANASKFAFFYCAEAAQCKEGDNDLRTRLAARAGAQMVYDAQVSLVQPDFTSECRQAQQAGAQALLVALDTTGVHRVAQSCDRQNYHPVFLAFSGTIDYQFKDESAIQRLLWNGQGFPFAGTETPARQEFHDVMDAYLGRPTSPVDGGGWVSGKTFELAATRAAAAAQSITPATLIDALNTFQNETLDGLTVPITFTAGQPHLQPDCWFSLDSHDGQWFPVNDGQMICG